MATKEKKMHLHSAARELNLDRTYQVRSTACGQVYHPPVGFTRKVILQHCSQQEIIKKWLTMLPPIKNKVYVSFGVL